MDWTDVAVGARRLMCWLTWHRWVNQRDGYPDVRDGHRLGDVKCERCDRVVYDWRMNA